MNKTERQIEHSETEAIPELAIPKVLDIAGSDSSGGAGMQTDIATIRRHGCFPLCAVSCVTSQSSCGLRMLQPMDLDIFKDQIISAFEDFGVDPGSDNSIKAVKIGMIPSGNHLRVLIEALSAFLPSNVVIDPVMAPTLGEDCLEKSMWRNTEVMLGLGRLTTLFTPNFEEAAAIAGMDPLTARLNPEISAAEIAKILHSEYGFENILIKGIPYNKNADNQNQGCSLNAGIGDTDSRAIGRFESIKDICFIAGDKFDLNHDFVDTRNSHGTGCTLSSAIAANLACGHDLKNAVIDGAEFVHAALLAGKDFRWYAGKGHGPTLIIPPDVFSPDCEDEYSIP